MASHDEAWRRPRSFVFRTCTTHTIIYYQSRHYHSQSYLSNPTPPKDLRNAYCHSYYSKGHKLLEFYMSGYYISILSLLRRQIDINFYHSIMVSVEARNIQGFPGLARVEIRLGKGALVSIGSSVNVLYLYARVGTYLRVHQILFLLATLQSLS